MSIQSQESHEQLLATDRNSEVVKRGISRRRILECEDCHVENLFSMDGRTH
ncbi:MAG: hypothetical protein JWP89_2091 [Schlesneria sp.]|nr:hypothetical protein [Schlesneria sp.]